MSFHVPRRAQDDQAGPCLNLYDAIDEFYVEFPEHSCNVFILNHSALKDGVAASTQIRPTIMRLKEAYPDLSYGPFFDSMIAGAFEAKMPCSVNIGQSMFNMQDESKIYARVVVPAGDQFHARALKSLLSGGKFDDLDSFPKMPPDLHNTEMWQRYVLDHELGHAVTILNVNKQDAKNEDIVNRRECEADAYAMIRHFQRYGQDSQFPAYIRDLRNMNALHRGDIGHWTARAIDRVMDMNKSGSLKDASPQQARDMAIRIAADVRLSSAESYNLSAAIKPMRKAFAGRDIDEGDRVIRLLCTAADIGVHSFSPVVLDICTRYVDAFMRAAPRDLPCTISREDLAKTIEQISAMRVRKLSAEPDMPHATQDFRHAMIDAISGKRGKKPPGPNI